jgi:hypothetical protein
MNQLYKKEEYIVFPVEEDFIVCNTKKVFDEGHTHVKRMDIAKLLISLAIEKKLPKNPHLVDNLIRISIDKDYIKQLKEFKEDSNINFAELMQGEDRKPLRRVRGALRGR